jgi:cell fate (sporulation/competence/biofilm development) regulator YlbF (YheA/YmcA/DUF963 family)
MMTQVTMSTPTMTGAAETGVRAAAQAFAQALAETPQFKVLEQAGETLAHDLPAQQAIAAYEAKQQSLQMMLRLNMVSPEERLELTRLHQVMLAEPVVATYLEAQANFAAVCQAAVTMLSERIGLNFAAACRSGCCG